MSEINRVFNEKGPDSLPVVLVNDKVVKVGSYPTNEEFAEWFGVKAEELMKSQKSRLID